MTEKTVQETNVLECLSEEGKLLWKRKRGLNIPAPKRRDLNWRQSVSIPIQIQFVISIFCLGDCGFCFPSNSAWGMSKYIPQTYNWHRF